MKVFSKKWFFGGLDQVKIDSNSIAIKTWGREKSYPWNQVSAELCDSTVVMSSPSMPLKRRTLYLKTGKKNYRIRLSNQYSSEIKNPDQFLQELGKYVAIERVQKRDFSQLKINVLWAASLLLIALLYRFLQK